MQDKEDRAGNRIMCLAKVFTEGDELLLEGVAFIKEEDGRVKLRTIFGEEKEIRGRIIEIDFVKSRVNVMLYSKPPGS